jgi:hypothetical protein
MSDDLALLRQYEPVIRYTHGEHFFPFDVARYVGHCGLWEQPERSPAREIVPHGELIIDDLPRIPAQDGIQFLQFVEPLGGRDLQRALAHPNRPRFHARGRLARVGLVSRIVDAMFTLTLMLRGTVPGGTSSAAEQAYRDLQAQDERYTYYGRVLRHDDYLVLHYLFFYCMNDWRSAFHGVNDHEADWEQVVIYLEDRGSEPPRPAWIAYATHDHQGDDLRRRWDDPEVEKIGDHPVVYAGAGSHASYFVPGEYLVTVSLSPLKPLIRVLRAGQRFWRDILRQGDPEPAQDIGELFRIPFVDYARGDGLSIGPGGDKSWSPVLLDPVPAWVSSYRGLWGFYARDPVSGENAPAGPKFKRDSTIRQSWHDPLGWSGLHKVDPPGQMAATLSRQLAALQASQADDRAAAGELHAKLRRLHAQDRALLGQHHLDDARHRIWAEVRQHERELHRLYAAIAERGEIIRACQQRLDALAAGDIGPLRAHIRHPHQPQSAEEIRTSSLAESWAAFSVGLLLVALVLLLVTRDNWLPGVGVLIAAFTALEIIFREGFETLILRVTLALSLAAMLVLIYEFFWQIVLLGVMAVGLLIICDNLRELRG